MQAQLSNVMFQILKEKIGEEVSCLSWENGQMIEYRGILNSVVPFDGVTIDEDFVSFVGQNQAIQEISHLKTSQTIYLNPDTLDYGKEEVDTDYKVK